MPVVNENFEEIVFLVLVCFAFWSLLIGIASHSVGWLVFAAIWAALSMIVWSE